jgi:DNA-binding transcriptional LysR family regulator
VKAIDPDAWIASAYDPGVDLDLRHLRTVNAIVEEGTFGRAGRRLGYTQSSVSQQVAALERAVGGQVFDRPGGPTGVRLTGLGKLIVERARPLLRSAQELGNAVEKFRAAAGRLDIGTFQSVSTVILPDLVGRVREEHPSCEIRLFEGEEENPRIGDLDLLFSDGPLDDDVHSAKLLDDPYVLVARPGDFPAGTVDLGSLSGRAMVAWPVTCSQPRLERALTASGSTPRIVFRSANNDTLLAMVRSRLGCAILPRLAVAGVGPDDRLAIHSLDPSPQREIHLHWPARRSLSPVARRAIQIVAEIAGADWPHAAPWRAAARP